MLQCIEIRVRKIFKPHHFIAGRLDGSDQFVQLEMYSARVAVLGILHEEDHQERDNSGACVDDQLPSIRIVKRRTRNGPSRNNNQAENKRSRRADKVGRRIREAMETLLHVLPSPDQSSNTRKS